MTEYLREDLRLEPSIEIALATLKPEKLKAKVRQGLPLAVKEKENFYKRIILQGKPLLDIPFDSVPNALNEAWNCGKFDRRNGWEMRQNVSVRKILIYIYMISQYL